MVTLTVVVCHKVPKIEVMVHFSYMQLMIVLWATRRGNLNKLVKGMPVVDKEIACTVSKKR